MHFEWDPAKAASNAAKHGVTFEEATEVFAPHAAVVDVPDHRHSAHEPRFLRIGQIARGIVIVVWTERVDDVIVIISARFASRSERALYRRRLKG